MISEDPKTPIIQQLWPIVALVGTTAGGVGGFKQGSATSENLINALADAKVARILAEKNEDNLDSAVAQFQGEINRLHGRIDRVE